ncbi:MAG: gem-associated 2 [Trebouxia sp. A1-2]|nr:MAG: gem-associated 2 [Trebouxia sp. A1-2]
MDVSLEELHIDQEGRTTALNGEDENSLDMEDAEIFDYDAEGGEIEEEWSEDDDRPTQYDLRQYGVYQSLPIPPGPPDMQSDCDTAEEYIKRVRYEAEQLPQTVTSHIDPRAFDAQRTDYVPVQDEGSLTAAECIPSQQWLTEFLADFAGLRSQLHREQEDIDPFLPRAPPPPPPHPLPHFRDKNGWQRYCLGVLPAHQQQQPEQPLPHEPLQTAAEAGSPAGDAPANTEATHSLQAHLMTAATDAAHPAAVASLPLEGVPMAGTAASISDQPTRGVMAEAQATAETTDSMSAAEAHNADAGAALTPADGHPPQMAVLASLDQVTINYLLQWHVNWALASPDITDLSMRWLYALMAQIGKPIALESSSQLSKLLRHCIKARRQISDDNDIRLLSLHMLIALSGGYFGQDGTLAACMQSGWL